MADQVPIQTNQVLVGVGNDFGVGEFDEVSVIFNQLVGIEGRQTLCMKEEVLSDFIADNFGQNQPTHLCGTKRQRGLVESPGGKDSSG